MIKLESTKMQKAIARAKQMHPTVRMTAERTYSVTGSKGALYTVHFALAKDAKGNTVRLGECDCPAGRQEMMCYHVAAAAAVNIAIHSMRQAAAQAAQQAAAERAQLISDIKATWQRVHPFASLEGAVHQVFGVTKLEDVPTDDLLRILAALAPTTPTPAPKRGAVARRRARAQAKAAATAPAATAPAPVAQPRPARSFIVIYSATVDACALGSSLQPGSASVLRVRPVTSLVAS